MLFRIKNIISSILFGILMLGCFGDGLSQNNSLTETDLRQINVDELDDNQISRFVRRAEEAGMTMEELEIQAIERGMPYDELLKLRERINIIKQDEEIEKDEEQDRDKERDLFDLEDEEELLTEDDLEKEEEKDSIFGSRLFRRERLTFEPNLNMATPKNYIIGPGDQLGIDVWGASQQSFSPTVTPEGHVKIGTLGNIQVSGLTIEEASELIESRLATIFSGLRGPNPNTFAHISLGRTRTITVTIAGEVYQPGTYALPSLATVFNALYHAGGPGEKGSFRSIKVIRNNETVATIDLYDFLTGGDLSTNVRLRDEDLVFVDTYHNRVAVSGEVKRPALYELKEGETLEKLINYAGGFTQNAYKKRVRIERKTETQRRMVDVEGHLLADMVMNNGDEVAVAEILDRFENRVTLQGAVFQPGAFAHREGMTLTQLIDLADGLREDVFMNRASIYRQQENLRVEVIPIDLQRIYDGVIADPVIKPNDLVSISSIFEIEQAYHIQIQGEVMNPGPFPYSQNISLGEVIRQAGGMMESASLARVEVARRISDRDAIMPGNQVAEVFSFPLDEDLSLDDEASSFILNPFDIVFVRRSPSYQPQQTVTITGEVAFPGVYVLESRDDRISDIIRRSGGLTESAYTQGASLKRLSSQAGQDKDTTKYVGIDLPTVLNGSARVRKAEDILLLPGDVVHVPRELETVTVDGAVMHPLITRYGRRRSVRDYVSEAGGFADRAHRKRVYVVHPNGMSDRTRSYLLFRSYPDVEPGSQIFVPLKPERDRRVVTEAVSIASSTASLALMVVTIINSAK